MSLDDRFAAGVAKAVVSRYAVIVLATLVVTIVLAPGIGALTTEAGSDQFAEDVPEFEAWETVTEEFEPVFGSDETTTQLIHTDENVLDRSALLAELDLLGDLHAREDLRVVDSSGPAVTIAEWLDPDATTPGEYERALEGATDRELEDAIEALADDPGFSSLLSDDFNAEAGEASTSIAIVTHEVPGDGEHQSIQLEAASLADGHDADVVVFGSGIIDAEFENVIADSLAIVIPAALLLILTLLGFAYRDPIDFALGTVCLLLTIVWTFGFTGYAGIPFSDMLVAVPVLLLAIGIDFGIHTINRYREERLAGVDVQPAMERSMEQLVVAYAIIAGTTVIGFSANLTSDLGAIRDFGVVAGIGILFTLFIFAVFMPAAMVTIERIRERYNWPAFGQRPLGADDSILGRVLPYCSHLSRPSPAIFLIFVLVLTAGLGAYGVGVDTTFDDEDFLPPESLPGWMDSLPGELAPSEYTATETINYLEANFETAEDDEVILYVEGRIADDYALEALVRPHEDPPDSFVERDGRAETDTVLDPMYGLADDDPAYAARLQRADTNGNGVPDRNLEELYDELLASPWGPVGEEYLTDDRRSTRVTYEVESDASTEEITEDAREHADRYHADAIPTGQIVVLQAVADVIFESAVVSLTTALVLAGLFLIFLYHLFVGRASLGVMNLLPVVVTICVLTATMRALGIPFNALTATILSITIGLGVDYTVHVTHRFYDEYERTADVYGSVVTTLKGTGGALTGTMLTTAMGIGVLVLAITPILGQFGLLTAFSIVVAYLSALVVLPPALVCWVAVTERRPELLIRP